MNKLRPGTITRVDPLEDGFKSSSNATKFLAAATRVFKVSPNDLFERDDLLQSQGQGTTGPEGAYRVARSIIAVIVRVGEGAEAAERAAGKVMHGRGHGEASSTSTSTRAPAHATATVNSPYGTRTKAASASTPNLSTLQRSVSPTPTPAAAKRWSPPSPSLPTVRSNSPAEDSAEPAAATGSRGRDSTAAPPGKDVKDLSASASSCKTAKTTAVAPASAPFPKSPPPPPRKDRDRVIVQPASLPNESALVTDSEDDSDANETFHDAETIPDKAHLPMAASSPAPPTTTSPASRTTHMSGSNMNAVRPRPPSDPMRTSVASGTTQTTAQSSLLAPALGSAGTGDRASANFGTFRTNTTVATSVAASSDLQSLYRADSSSMAPSVSEGGSYWENESVASASGSVYGPYAKMRDRKPSEAANNDLTRVAEEVEEGTLNAGREGSNGSASAAEVKRRQAAVQLGKGKWPDDFISAFQAPPSSRAININRSGQGPGSELEKPGASPPHSVSPPRKFAYIGESPPASGSFESLSHSHSPHLGPRRPVHRPRHSLDAPVLLPKEAVYGAAGGRGDQGPGGVSDALAALNPRVQIRRNSSTNRHGMYIPRSNSASPSPSADLNAAAAAAGARVPFPRTVSGDHTGPSALEGSLLQQGRLGTRGRFQSEDASTRRKPRPNSFDELGGKPNRSRIESMISLGGVSSSNFSASDIRSSMDGSAVRKTLIIRDEGQPNTHFVSIFFFFLSSHLFVLELERIND